MLGTDYPFDMGMYEPVDFVEGCAEFTDADKDVTMTEAEVVEVLDTENEAKWLVRSAQQKDNV